MFSIYAKELRDDPLFSSAKLRPRKKQEKMKTRAKILIDISKVQDEEVGDGTTTVAVLAGELLREAEKLIQNKIHPQIIIKGWREAKKTA